MNYLVQFKAHGDNTVYTITIHSFHTKKNGVGRKLSAFCIVWQQGTEHASKNMHLAAPNVLGKTHDVKRA